jgi:hypothetical protein
MGCRICGRECPPEARICRDCAAARKRAFAQTVTQPLLAAVGVPTVSAPRFAPKPLRPRAANDSKVQRAKVERAKIERAKVERDAPRPDPEPALPLTQVPRRLSVLWLLGSVVLVAVAVGLLLRTSGNGGHPGDDAAPTVEPLPAAPPAAPLVTAPAPVSVATSAEHSTSELPAPKAPAVKPRKIAPRIEAPSPVTVPSPQLAEPAPVTRSPPPAPRPVEAPRTDPWQAMNEGLARCAREALFDRIGCEQKLRQQYCGNSWGLVPQCPIGPANDHGQ